MLNFIQPMFTVTLITRNILFIFFLSLSIGIYAQCPPSGGGSVEGNITITTSCTVNGDLDLTKKNITIASGGTLTVNGDFLNSGNGIITVDGGTLDVSGSFENAGNGTVEVDNGGQLSVGADYSNGGNGTSNFIDGTINITGNYTNEGNGNILADGIVTVGGDFTVNGNGTTTVSGDLTIGGAASMGSKGVDIEDGGVLQANSIASGGNIDIELGGTLYIVSGSMTGTVNNDPGNADQDCSNNCCGQSCNIAGDMLSEGETLLPIELLYFKAHQEGGNVVLEWASASEENNDFYTIERSTDGLNFDRINEVPGAGNSIAEIQYELLDAPEASGLIYYRLSQTDFDGTTEVFPLVVVNYRVNLEYHVFPTLVRNEGIVQIQLNTSSFQLSALKIVDLKGQNSIVPPILIQGNTISIQTKDLPAGIYFLKADLNNQEVSTRFVISS